VGRPIFLCTTTPFATCQPPAHSLEWSLHGDPQLKPQTAVFSVLICLSLEAIGANPPRTGAQIFQVYCTSCHGGGWQGAPVANDKTEWEPRMTKGFDALLKSAKQGMNAMPPMGTCMDCTDDELAASIKEMLEF
jgi:cytochrome c5